MSPENAYVVATIIVVLIPFLVTGIIAMCKPEGWQADNGWVNLSGAITAVTALIIMAGVTVGVFVFAIWGLAQLFMGVG